MKPTIHKGDTVTLTNGVECLCINGWHGRDEAWISVQYRHGDGPVVTRDVESYQISSVKTTLQLPF